MDELSTKGKFQLIGKQEFLEKSFNGASLREIVKKSGFTLGAFYGYYANKEALFVDIVGKKADSLYNQCLAIHDRFFQLPEGEQHEQMQDASKSSLLRLIDLLYEDLTVFELVFFRSIGTRYEDFLRRFIDIEIDATKRYIAGLNHQGYSLQIDDEVVHILASAMFSGMREVVGHHMNKEKATVYIGKLSEF
ncbi:MAG: TetR/AcrR family transcriptional regulator [Clostridiales bacterium]|nr:TetR/AcrR family transcriptional regulator [Clostridiales bacterium]